MAGLKNVQLLHLIVEIWIASSDEYCNCNKLGEIYMKVAVAFIFLTRKSLPKLSQFKLLWRKHNSYIFQLAKGAVLEMRCESCSVCRRRHFHRLSTHSAVFVGDEEVQESNTIDHSEVRLDRCDIVHYLDLQRSSWKSSWNSVSRNTFFSKHCSSLWNLKLSKVAQHIHLNHLKKVSYYIYSVVLHNVSGKLNLNIKISSIRSKQ